MTLIYTYRELETVCMNVENDNYTQLFIDILYLGYYECHTVAT